MICPDWEIYLQSQPVPNLFWCWLTKEGWHLVFWLIRNAQCLGFARKKYQRYSLEGRLCCREDPALRWLHVNDDRPYSRMVVGVGVVSSCHTISCLEYCLMVCKVFKFVYKQHMTLLLPKSLVQAHNLWESPSLCKVDPFVTELIILEFTYLGRHLLAYHQVPSIETPAQYDDGDIDCSFTTSTSGQSWQSLPKFRQVLPVAASTTISIVTDIITTNCGRFMRPHNYCGHNSKTQYFRRKE